MRFLVLLLSGACLCAGAGPLSVAQSEYDRYCRALTGGEPPKAEFAVDATLDAAHDEYRIESAGEGVRFTGANERSVLYAVYDFLARRGGCRWFWDGDVVPRRETIDCRGLDVREKSQFEYRGIRYFAHRGLTRFQAEHWGLEDWKREIDWCVKNRLNVMMPRIGMDDTWQKAYPDIVPYPDPAKPLPEALKGFDNRTLFWSLEYRGKLRKAFTAYAEERGLDIPVDFGTMTHWYSRTPRAYLEKAKPEFLPQATSTYGEDTGRVFDIRKPGYLDSYWRLTDAFIGAGYGRPDYLHTIGLGERMVYTNRADNLALKLDVLDRLISSATNRYPQTKVMLAGWDFYYTWRPEEVQSLLGHLDPAKTIVWDYEADAPRREWDDDRGGWKTNNFTLWGLKGRFPYTFGIFLCYEAGIDIRADYPLIEERQRTIEDDPMCKGYILWPESSHTDVFALRYFTENAWRAGGKGAMDLLPQFCRDRYGDCGPEGVRRFEAAWRKVIPASGIAGWSENFGLNLTCCRGRLPLEQCGPSLKEMKARLSPLDGVFDDLKGVWGQQPSVRVGRDSIDLARTAADRLGIALRLRMVEAFDAWAGGRGSEAEVLRLAGKYADFATAFADLLELHTDYSLWESYERLDRIEKIRNPDFQHVLVDNAINGYCRSHQYEAARYWYEPLAKAVSEAICARVRSGERRAVDDAALERLSQELERKMRSRPLREMRPTAARTSARFDEVLGRLSAATREFRAFNVVPLPQGNEKQIAADCVEYVRRTGNRVCLCSMTLHPEGNPAMEKPRRNFETYRRLKEELKGTDVQLGILIQSIMGHWPRVDREVEPWMRTVNIDGEAVRFCPLDPGFADYIRTIGRMCAAERPAFILGDDDIRASAPKAECFCERHRRLFCERMGREFSAEEFRAAVKGSRGGEKAHEVFVGLQLEMVDRSCRLLREGIDSVDPAIPAGTCMSWMGRHYNDRAAKAIAAKGQRPVMRLCSANYFEMRLDDYPWNVLKTLALAAQFKDTTDLLDESDTCPHNYWSKTAVGLHAHLVTAMFAGLRGAKLWYVGMHKGAYPVNPGYLDTLAANRGFYATLFGELEGSSFVGLAAPCQARIPADPFPAYQEDVHWRDSFITHLAGQFGVPFWATFDLDRKDTVYSLSDAREVALFNDAELKRILSGHVLVDGSGAVELVKRGFADLIGCEATPEAKGFNAERLTATGGRIVLQPAAKPALLKAKPGTGVLSELGYVPFAGSPDFEVVAPGATVCTNRLGGRVVVTAYPHDCVAWYKHNEARKDWFVACLDAANGAPLPFVCGNAQPVLTLAKRLADGSHLVAVYNLCFEGMRETSLRLPDSAEKVELLGADGVWRPLAFRRGANGYAAFDVALPCYGVAVFKIR